jgi:dehydrogenase/reductase SDR family protein 12
VPRTTETTTVTATQESAFAEVADFSHLAEWDPTFVRSDRVDDGPLGVGSTFDCEMTILDVRVPLLLEITRYDAPQHVTLEGRGSGFTTREDITVRGVGEGRVEVTYDSAFDTDKPDWVDAMGQPAFTLVGKAAIRGLRDHLEEEA